MHGIQEPLKTPQRAFNLEKIARFTNRPLGTVFFLELYAGSARLTATVAAAGLLSLGVDSFRNRHKKLGCIATFDLTQTGQQAILFDLLEGGAVDVVHAAPPCGTGSRAREVRLTKHHHGPPPLRSETYPYGLPDISSDDKLRVEAANKLWEFTAAYLIAADSKGCLCSGENPVNAYLWKTYGWADIHSKWFHTIYQGCMHGGERPKWSLWISNWQKLQRLSVVCDNQHEHLPWGVKRTVSGNAYATAEEAAYPQLLCTRVTLALVDQLFELGVQHSAVSLDDSWDPTMSGTAGTKVGTLVQPKRSKLPPLIREYKDVETQLQEEPSRFAVGTRDDLGRKLIRRAIEKGNSGPAELKSDSGDDVVPGATGGDTLQREVWGVPWSVPEFFEQAVQALHPFCRQPALPDVLLLAVVRIFTNSPEHTARKRAREVQRWINLAKNLEPDEIALHDSLHPQVATALQGKRLKLFDHLLKESGYQDENLVDEIAKGFKVVGLAPPTGVFDKRIRLPELSESELRKAAVWTRNSVIGSLGPSRDDPELDNEVWKETRDEVVRGWLIETEAHLLDSEFGVGQWAPGRRFGIRQGKKVRAIDDFSYPMTNRAYGSSDKINLMGIDQVVNLARVVAKAVKSGFVLVKLSDGSFKGGKVHRDWEAVTRNGGADLCGRLLDLWKAYRGLASCPESDNSRWTIVAVWSPEDKRVRLFKQPVLAFGATASVLSFNRVSRAVWHLGVHYGDLLWLNYFDDYPHVETKALTHSAWRTSEAFVELLGWKISKNDKRLDFSATFAPLGVEVVLESAVEESVIVVRNKQSRVDELSEYVSDIIRRNRISMPELDRLRGRIQFAESFTFARMSRFVLSPFAEDCRSKNRAIVVMDDLMREAMTILKEIIIEIKPRRVPISLEGTPVVIFTDGACEGSGNLLVSCGAVIVYEDRNVREWFGIQVPQELVDYWQMEADKIQVIAEAEMLPVIISRMLIGQSSGIRLVLHFVDNDGVSDSLIKGFSRSANLRLMLKKYVQQECGQALCSWIARVPSPSNPADGPSRLVKKFDDSLDRGVDVSRKAMSNLEGLVPYLTRRDQG